VSRAVLGPAELVPATGAEHRAAREGVILMDMSFMAKFLVQGRDAGRCSTGSRPTRSTAPPGVITYTQWLNEGGTLEADLTVTKLDDERFWVVASTPPTATCRPGCAGTRRPTRTPSSPT
jgi:glycine cleavage system aminomethyltransferase T